MAYKLPEVLFIPDYCSEHSKIQSNLDSGKVIILTKRTTETFEQSNDAIN